MLFCISTRVPVLICQLIALDTMTWLSYRTKPNFEPAHILPYCRI